MNRYMRILILILALAGLWAAGGYMIGAALETIGFDSYPLSTIIAAINVIIGMVLFKMLTNDPEIDQLFFEKPLTNYPHYPAIGCLWLVPILVVIFGAMMWFWAIILGIIFFK